MSDSTSSRKIALSLLIISLLALGVGLFNAAMHTYDSVTAGRHKGKGILGSLDAPVPKRKHLMLIDLQGPIMMDPEDGSLFSSDSSAVSARKALEDALEDDSVVGVLIKLNSPGGTVGMSQELNAAVKRVSKKKPVVAYMGDVAASGAYYTACAADKIISNPGTLTASIGVIISTLNLKGLVTDKLGVKATTIKSGKFKDILSPYRDARPEEVAMIQRMINISYQQFLGAVIEGRTRFFTEDQKKEKEARIASIKEVADGRIVVGEDAVRVGLVDENGDITYAYEQLDKMAKERFNIKGKGKDKLPLEEYSEKIGIMDIIGLPSGRLRLPVPQATSQTAIPSIPGVPESLVPFSYRHRNQLLWIME